MRCPRPSLEPKFVLTCPSSSSSVCHEPDGREVLGRWDREEETGSSGQEETANAARAKAMRELFPSLKLKITISDGDGPPRCCSQLEELLMLNSFIWTFPHPQFSAGMNLKRFPWELYIFYMLFGVKLVRSFWLRFMSDWYLKWCDWLVMTVVWLHSMKNCWNYFKTILTTEKNRLTNQDWMWLFFVAIM